MKTYTINSELGLMRDVLASSIDEAKEKYTEKFGYDFDGFDEYPGTWYWINENGVRVEDETECMP